MRLRARVASTTMIVSVRASWICLALTFAVGCDQPISRVGGPCDVSSDCSAGPSQAVCVTQAEANAAGFSAPGGYCTGIDCQTSDPNACGPGATCLLLPGAASPGCYQTCSLPGDCRSGFECALGICRPMPLCVRTGDACKSAGDCCAGLRCDGNVCVANLDLSVPRDLGPARDMHVPYCTPGDDGCAPCSGCYPNCVSFMCADDCGQACTGCNLAVCGGQGTESTQSVQATETIGQNVQATETTQNVQNTETVQNVQNVQNTETLQNTETTQNTETLQNTETTQDVQDTQSTETVSECFDCSKVRGQKLKTKPAPKRKWWKLWQ